MSTATIHDVAQAAGVSIKTVSRVINGEPAVRQRTREKVEAAIAKLQYHPNRAARTLRTGVPDLIALLVDSVSDPFFAQMAQVVQAEAVARGMDVVVVSTGGSDERARSQIDRLIRQGIHGIVLAPVHSLIHSSDWIPTTVPVVVVDRPIDSDQLDNVTVADAQAAASAVEHLLACGHRRIGFIANAAWCPTVCGREAGYRQSLIRHGLEADQDLIATHLGGRELCHRMALDMLAQADPPTALLAGTSLAGEAVAAALIRSDVQSHVGLVVFGDFPLAQLLRPAITVIDQDPAAMARVAVRRLLDRVQGDSPRPEHIVLPATLVPRGSGELPGPFASPAA